MFLSGAKAEGKARELAGLSRRIGEDARVQVFTRDGRLAPELRPLRLAACR